MNFFVTLVFTLSFTAQVAAQYAERQVVQASEPERQHYFGSSGDIDGDLAVITVTHGKNPLAWNGGLAFVYQLRSGQWQLRNTLYPEISANQDRFGQNACALSGKRIIVGDWMNAQYQGGAAHIFELSGDTNWSHVTTLAPSNKEKYDHFGNRVAIDGNTAAVSTYSEVFIYAFEQGKWTKKQILTGAQEESNGFGQSLALEGNQLIVGSTWEDAKGVKNAGAVYVYVRKNNQWFLQQKLIAQEKHLEERLEFGASVALSKNLLAIGVPNKDMGQAAGAGAVYLYRKINNQWAFSNLLYNEKFRYGIYGFGTQISLSGDYMAVTEAQDEAYNPSIYMYQFVDEKPKLISKIQETDAIESNRFTKEFMSISGNRIVAGDGADSFCDDLYGNCGRAYFYEITPYKLRELNNSEVNASNWGFSDAEVKSLKRKFNGDRIVFDPVNGDLVYKMRDKETKLWGMYQGEKVLIPAEYDSLAFFGWNHPYTTVEKDGLLGIYTSNFDDFGKLSVECNYEDFHTYTYEGQFWLAGKRDSKWRWVNWFNGYEASQKFEYHQELYILENWSPGR